ncbi:tigger transposable element-derived protein 1-like [Tiliqua scincoides]|uniref:tigger transposable element-derived protein 1-like n=1 Tax=Tiliqua scincoides TaxID=71010 RepID=UPI003461D822
MSSKGNASRSGSENKRKRHSITLDVKLEIIRRSKSGERPSEIARIFHLPPTSVHTILKNAKQIETKGRHALKLSEVKITRLRSEVMERMERLLVLWLEDLYAKNVPVGLALIQQKAMSLYGDLKKDLGEEEAAKEKPFKAARGWFYRFQKRHGFRNVKIQEEAARADMEAAESFLEELRKITEDGSYDPRQVFSVDETGLYWKHMPSHTDISAPEKSASGFKASQDRVTLLVGGNARGDKKLKPLLVYSSENPQALKNMAKFSLPVIWKSQHKAWIMRQIFRDWFVNYLVPELKEYCEERNLAFKILLLLDNASAHNLDFEALCPNIKIHLLPPRSTAIMQPRVQGVIAALKRYYLRRPFRKLVGGTDKNDELSVHEFWREFNTLDWVQIIGESRREVSDRLMNATWNNSYPSAMCSFEHFDAIQIQSELVKLAKNAGFEEVAAEGVEKLLESHALPLTNEELEELDRQAFEEDCDELDREASEEEDDDQPSQAKGLTVPILHSLFEQADRLVELLKENDPLHDRALKVEKVMKDTLACYQEILNTKLQKGEERNLDTFFQREKPVTENPQPGPSGLQKELSAATIQPCPTMTVEVGGNEETALDATFPESSFSTSTTS